MSQSLVTSWNVIQSKIIHKTPWIELIEDICLVGDKQLKYTYTRRTDEGPLIIAEEFDGSLWLVRQYRHPINKIIWQFPGEGKHPNETWKQAAIRGLQEELKLKANHLEELGLYYTDPGGLDQKYVAFLATGLTRINLAEEPHLNSEIEDLEIHKFTLPEIDQLIDRGDICDNWTLTALFLYQRFKRSQHKSKA